MQDIPRNELLDKLAAGWKVRRKKWSADNTFSVKGKESVPAEALIADDWEGEPPGPALKGQGFNIIIAFMRLQNGAAFIRRSSWQDGRRTCLISTRFEIDLDELLATDWEVWG